MIAPLVAFAIGPVGRYFVLGGMLLAMVLGVWWKIDHDARQSALAAVERANRKAQDAADAAQRDVLTCPAGKWNRETGTCER
jgi:hypothetical protein